MEPRRIERLQEFIKARVAEILLRNVADPKLGMVTITRTKLDREMESCKIYWSIIGDAKVRRQNQGALNRARAYIQRELASTLTTRTVPRLSFEFDESIEGAVRVQGILSNLAKERAERERSLAEAAGNTVTDDDAPDADSTDAPSGPEDDVDR